MVKRVVIAGGSGFIGSSLIMFLNANGYESIVLTRDEAVVPGARGVVKWDGEYQGQWSTELEGVDAVINLAGATIAQHWSEDAKLQILQSRLNATRAIAEAIRTRAQPPPVWINASGINYYGDRGDEELTEDSEPGKRGDFLVDTCVAWEHEIQSAPLEHTRKVWIRFAPALGEDGGMLEPLEKAASWFMGGPIGSGQQFMSWIHMEDLCRLIIWAVENPVEGPLNGSAPKPVRNAEFMATLRGVMGRPFGLPIPAFLLRLVEMFGGPPASLLLEGQRVIPRRALEGGFEFRYAEVRDALRELLAK